METLREDETGRRELERRCEALRAELSELLEREKEHRAVFDAAVDAIVTIDGRGRILSVNPATLEMFDRTRDELIGHNVGLLMPSPFREEHDGYIRRYCETRQPHVIGSGCEVVGQRKDGSTFPIDLTLSEVSNGEPRFAAILRDLSERKRLEDEVFQAQKLEAIGRLSGGIAHDFNNLLMGIMGCCNMAEQEIGDCEAARKLLADMKDAVHRGGALTQQLLTFGRKRRGARVPLSLNDVIRTAERMLSQVLGEDVTITTRLTGSGAWLRGDAGRLEQVLANLAVNAREAMPDGGELTFETRDLELGPGEPPPASVRRAAKTGRFVVLSVTDSGRGMTPETISRIFEPFFTTKEVGDGSGLGLSTVYGIVRELDGHINVGSAPGQGTTFTLYFPAVKRPPAASKQPDRGSAGGGGEVILLVEDDTLVRRSVQYYLTRLGYRVLAAGDPEQALKVLDEHEGPIELLVTDMVMPGMNGADLAAAVHARDPAMRVLIMSAHSAATLRKQGRLQPGQAFLEKPFELEDLAPRVREALDGVSGPAT